MTLSVVVVAAAGVGCGAAQPEAVSRSNPPAGAPAPAHPRTALAAPASTSAVAAERERRLARGTSHQGSLSPTAARPAASTRLFRALMASLWAGIVDDAAGPALAAFFPKGAYEQLKAIPGAGSDWKGRLVHDYRLDVEAAHGLLGADARRARLLGVHVEASYAHWVPPGVCANRIGYWEMPDARVVYTSAGAVRSFGIASMISWRGVWYVVHLGAILRSADIGLVDSPAAGRGSSAYSGTC